MDNAIGGLTNLVIIVVFLVLVSGYLAFNVNYTKAFRVKNEIITTIEQYEGNCEIEGPCQEKIENYMSSIGYAPNGSLSLEGDSWICPSKGAYCIMRIDATSSTGGIAESKLDTYYYKVVTQINLDLPIVNKILPRFLQVSGTTRIITKSKST